MEDDLDDDADDDLEVISLSERHDEEDHRVAGEPLQQLTQALRNGGQESLRLCFGDRQITDDTLGQSGDRIGQCASLISIDLDFQGNQITGKALGRFGDGIGRCGELTKLRLNFWRNQITGETLGAFGEGIGNCG
eukprot:CAMPEP_0204336334 /NCGR_PEP_ID=MMETSP0469-20131031/19453_1 /ASSEMBLY_ACC=CAM_ASM_000384 /TAXON_ID=2969 /ORGANISM="Oxyrrhis marina" /LENGTH=134 /DNA_ID=CAMNT_0051320183 /DNA_START=32 /DNA_END=432 /DNA_ORIENTATION=+